MSLGPREWEAMAEHYGSYRAAMIVAMLRRYICDLGWGLPSTRRLDEAFARATGV